MFILLYIKVERVANITRFLVSLSGVKNPRVQTTFNFIEVQSIALRIMSFISFCLFVFYRVEKRVANKDCASDNDVGEVPPTTKLYHFVS